MTRARNVFPEDAEFAWKHIREEGLQDLECVERPADRSGALAVYKLCPRGRTCDLCGEPIGSPEIAHQHRARDVELVFLANATNPASRTTRRIHSEPCRTEEDFARPR